MSDVIKEAERIISTSFATVEMICRPVIVCLCGSTSYKAAYELANKQETLNGKIVLSVGLFAHADGVKLSISEKEMLDNLHLRKIDLADEVLILDVDGYIGESTGNELNHARGKSKKIRFWSKEENNDTV